MKLLHLLILVSICFCSLKDLFNIDEISNAEQAYDKVEDLYKKYNKMGSGKEKDEFLAKLKEFIFLICKKFISNEELLGKLEKILDELKASDLASMGTHSVSFFINKETFDSFINTVKGTSTKLIDYCGEKDCVIPKEVLLKSENTLTTAATTSSKWVYVSNGVAVVGHGIAAYLRFKESYDKCKAMGKESIFLSAIQTTVNVGTNIAFGTVGSYIGTFVIPYPFVGSIVGGVLGSIVGSMVNYKLEFDC